MRQICKLILLVAFGFAVVAVAFILSTEASTVYEPYYVGSPDADTVYLVRRYAADSTLVDSTVYDTSGVTFPYDTALEWDNTKDYWVREVWHYAGYEDGQWYCSNIFRKFSAGTASVDYDSIQSLILGGGASGNAIVTWVIYDSSNSTTLQTVPVRIDNSSGVALAAQNTTAGQLSHRIDTGQYVKPYFSAMGYIQTDAGDSVYIDSTETDTIWCYEFSPTAPTLDNAGTVYGWLRGGGGDTTFTAYRRVHFTPVRECYNLSDSIGLPVQTVTCTTTSAGYFEATLYESASLARPGSSTSDTIQYLMSIDGVSKEYKFTKDSSATQRIVFGQ